MAPPPRVVITGASGLLGGNLAAELRAAGHEVIALRRGPTQTSHLADLDLTWREASLADVGALTAAFAGAAAVFHCAAAVSVRREVTAEMTAANVTATGNVIEAARAAGVGRLIHTSSVAAVGVSPDGTPCDERARWNLIEEGLDDGYARTKRAAEELVVAAADRLDVVIVNPGYMFGPRDARPSSGGLLLKIAANKIPTWTPGLNTFVDARDVARGMIAAWRRGRRGERYLLTGHERSYRALMTEVAALTGARVPRLAMPFALARVYGWWNDRIERRGGDPVANSTQLRYAYATRFRFTAAKAIEELGYVIRPLDETLRDTLAWFGAHGMLRS